MIEQEVSRITRRQSKCDENRRRGRARVICVRSQLTAVGEDTEHSGELIMACVCSLTVTAVHEIVVDCVCVCDL
jgi:hypothetical protein